jgi:hypothetical protein
MILGPASDMPADLIAYYVSKSETVVAGTVMFRGDGSYTYDVQIIATGSITAKVEGTRDTSAVVRESTRIFVTGGFNFLDFGEYDVLAGRWQNGGLTMRSTSTGIVMSGSNLSLTSPAQAVWATGTFATLNGGARLTLASGSEFLIDGVTARRALLTRVQSTSDSSAVGAEATVLTSGSLTFPTGRAFEFIEGARLTGSVANTAVARFRRTNATGAEILAWSAECLTAAQWRGFRNVAINNTGSDITQVVVMTIGATAGTVTQNGAATIPRYFEIWDCGAASDFSGAPSV